MRQAAAILGAGSFGTALAVHLSRIGHDVRLWARDPDLARQMTVLRANPVYLTDLTLGPSVTPTADLDEALAGADLVVCAVPSHGARQVLGRAAPVIAPHATIVSAIKGLEEGTLAAHVGADRRRCSARSVRWSALSGPSFAAEVGRGTANGRGRRVAGSRTPYVSCRRSSGRRICACTAATDVVGVEIGGALKNVIAIAAGVVEGMGLGHNALAGLITRGLAEMSRLACALGGRRETLAGLAGLGDLVLTCTGRLSRNRHVGIELARGRSLEEIVAGTKMVAEGVRTTDAALALGARTRRRAADRDADGGRAAGRRSPRAALEELMLRPQRAESDSRMIGLDRMGFFDRLAQGSRARPADRRAIREIVRGADAARAALRPIDVDTVEALEELLIRADLGVAGDRADCRRRSAAVRVMARACAIWCRARSSASSRRGAAGASHGDAACRC